MKPEIVQQTLSRLADLIGQGRFEELETDTLEIKPVPSDGQSWRERYKTACAFLNTRGGVIILGVKETGHGPLRKYIFTGWQPTAEQKVKEISQQFTDAAGNRLQIGEAFPPPMIVDFMDGQVAAVLVDELSADMKFAFYNGEAYRRNLTGDHKIPAAEIERQCEFKEEAVRARELQIVPDVTLGDLDIDKLNDYISQLNRPVKIETVKADLQSATPFLKRKYFLKDSAVTTLGVLVCGKHPADVLGFRCHVHGYVDVPQEIARDKQDLTDNILPLLEKSLSYVLRNIQVGISAERGGANRAQYPEELLRETVNNALAHRDYSIDRQVIIGIAPGKHILIQNPGSFRNHVLIQKPHEPVPLLRILPEAKPRNPKLADVLRVFRKWEGRGIGMATLVNLCLENRIDLPFYRLKSEEVALYLVAGRILDERMERLFASFDQYIYEKTGGRELTECQRIVLSYLIKSEWANEKSHYTILLTPDNNHYKELVVLKETGLINLHAASDASYPIFVVDRELLRKDYVPELRKMFGIAFDGLNPLQKEVLGVVYRFTHFSRAKTVSAKQASFVIWQTQDGDDDIKKFDAFYRRVRLAFNHLKERGLLSKHDESRGYILNADASQGLLGSNP